MSATSTVRHIPWQELPRVARWAFTQVWAIERGRAVALAILTGFLALVPAVLTAVLGELVGLIGKGAGPSESEFEAGAFWVGVAALVLLLGALAASFVQYLRSVVADALGLATTSLLLRHASRLDAAFFEDANSQDMLHLAAKDPGGTCFRFVQQLADMVSAAIQVLSLTAILFWIAPDVTWVLVLVGLPSLVVQWRLANVEYESEVERSRDRRWANYYAGRLVNAQHAASSRVLGLAPLFIARFEDATRASHDAQRKVYRLRLVYGSVVGVLFVAGLSVTLGWLGNRVVNQRLDVGQFAAFWVAAWRLGAALRGLASNVSAELFAGFSIMNSMRLLDVVPSLLPGAQHPPKPSGSLELRDVWFSYPGAERPVLRGVQLTVHPGETVALVGLNGAGKSTVGKLVARLYDPTQGAVRIDGVDVRELTEEFLREQVVFSQQQPDRFEASLHDNLAFGDWRRLLHDRSAVEQLVKETRLGTLVGDMPQGLDTRLGRVFGDRDLSGGQWRQLGVARALGRRGCILILDEPSAHLDALAEVEQAKSIDRRAEQRTTLIISHRLSTVMGADRIVVLDDGLIAESGTHAELVARGGAYARLWARHLGQVRPAGGQGSSQVEELRPVAELRDVSLRAVGDDSEPGE